jgi:hypothetical protein
MMKVRLELDEVIKAAQVGIARQYESLYHGRREMLGLSKLFEAHIIGALGEKAFAKALGLEWTEHTERFGPLSDVGEYHIRSTKYQSGKLRIDEHEVVDNEKYALMIQLDEFGFEWRVAGWCYSHEAKEIGWFGSLQPNRPKKSYWVEQKDLNQFEAIW